MTATAQSKASDDGTDQPAQGVWPMIKQTVSDFFEDKGPKLSASLAYYTIFSIAPLLVITLFILGMFLDDKAASGQVSAQVSQLVGSDAGTAINEMIAKAGENKNSGTMATILSLILLMFTASGVFGELQDSMNVIWEVKPKPNQGIWATIRARLLSMGMVLGIGFLLLTSMFVTTVVNAFASRLGGPGTFISHVLDFVLSIGVITVLFAAIFKFLPDVKIAWRHVWVGAAVTAALFTVGKIGLGIYLSRGSTADAFGAAGSLAVLLVWIYYSSWIMFMGAEFTQVWAKAHGAEIQPSENAVKLTDEDRARRGMVPGEELEQKAATGPSAPGTATMRPGSTGYYPPPPAPRPGTVGTPEPAPIGLSDYLFAAGGAVLGALGAWYIADKDSPRNPSRKHAAAVKLHERLNAVEAKLGRVSRIKQYLEDADVAARIEKVEKEIHRAGRHLRAEETGRPRWMVRLGDLIGGRWSNLSSK